MKNEEFSDAFATLLNSHNTKAEFGDLASAHEIVLDEYEKSIYLTQAQDIIVKSYFDKTLNLQGQGFDDTPRRQIDFSSLIKVVELTPDSSLTSNFDERGLMFKLPTLGSDSSTCEVLFILNEKVEYTKDNIHKTFIVVPINHREYEREMSKPFALPLKKQAWRLLLNDGSGFDVDTELIMKQYLYDDILNEEATIKYKIRYIRRPKPIVLEDLPNGLSIEGETQYSECELNPILHMDILTKAVELALSTRGGGTALAASEELTNRRRQ